VSAAAVRPLAARAGLVALVVAVAVVWPVADATRLVLERIFCPKRW